MKDETVMNSSENTSLCNDSDMSQLLERLSVDEADGRIQLARLLMAYPEDARLHFLDGSMLASDSDYIAAREAMQRAVGLAPDFAIARFQLGFLCLTSGEPHAAQEAWGPLHGLADNHYLRIFAGGLTHLIHDRFSEAIEMLKHGISQNDENAALNGDMGLIIEEIRRKLAGDEAELPQSSAQILLQQAALKGTRH